MPTRARLPTPLVTLIGYTADRFVALALPARGEPSPIAAGGTSTDWARLAGLGDHDPHESIRERYPGRIDIGDHDVDTVAHTTLQRLAMRGVVYRVPGLPIRYKPRPPRPKG